MKLGSAKVICKVRAWSDDMVRYLDDLRRFGSSHFLGESVRY